MDSADLKNLLAKLGRMRERVEERVGTGSTWDAKVSTGEIHRYALNGIKDFAQVGDDVENFFIWIWNAKDYLKRRFPTKAGWLEAEISADPCLAICGDLANAAKHGEHRNRSKRNPKLGKLTYTVPQEAIGKITVFAKEVQTEVSRPVLVTFEMPIYDGDGRTLGDAFFFLESAVRRWESLVAEMEGSTYS